MNKLTQRLLVSFLLACSSLAAASEFFAMDNGLRDVKSIAGKANLLKELGYDGVTWRRGNTAKAVKEMSAKNLKVCAFMMNVPVVKGKEAKFPLDDIKALKGTGAILWVQVLQRNSTDADAARELKRLNAIAKPMGLPIAIYPHMGNGVETLEDALKIATLVNDPNVGVSLTLCHQLKKKGVQDLKPLLQQALPHLKLVQISGAENGDTKAMGWDKLIQPLGSGSYDVKKLLTTLNELNYRGPVGVIGFGIKQPAAKHLKQSVEFWRLFLHEKTSP
jgi:sugar phosphate isomerase/epimerase